jgi:hypothetical protein
VTPEIVLTKKHNIMFFELFVPEYGRKVLNDRDGRSVRDAVPVTASSNTGSFSRATEFRRAIDHGHALRDIASHPVNLGTASNAPNVPAPPPTNPVNTITEKLDRLIELVNQFEARMDYVVDILEHECDCSGYSECDDDATDATDDDATDDDATDDDATDDDAVDDDDDPFELGQIVKYADGDSTRLARIVSIDATHNPPSFVIKLDDRDVDAFRDTEIEHLTPL